MKPSFDPVGYTIDVAKELVAAFETASRATTPGLVGGAREAPVRKRLQHLLPSGIGVGTGCIIDSFGNTSKQQDIVLYESALCPVFCINDSAETTYFPCEGVIAVGEVKSSVGGKELRDIFAKAESVKTLTRYTVRQKSQLLDEEYRAVRSYGNITAMEVMRKNEFNQENNPLDQIFFFSLAYSLSVSPDRFVEHFEGECSKADRYITPNLLVFLNDGIVAPVKPGNRDGSLALTISAQGASAFMFSNKGDENFQFLLSRIVTVFRAGRTTPLSAYDRYITMNGKVTLPRGKLLSL